MTASKRPEPPFMRAGAWRNTCRLGDDLGLRPPQGRDGRRSDPTPSVSAWPFRSYDAGMSFSAKVYVRRGRDLLRSSLSLSSENDAHEAREAATNRTRTVRPAHKPPAVPRFLGACADSLSASGITP